MSKKKQPKFNPIEVIEQIPDDVEECVILLSRYEGTPWCCDGRFETKEDAIKAATITMTEPESPPEQMILCLSDFRLLDGKMGYYRMPMTMNYRDLEPNDGHFTYTYS